jgi:hypothetical protein
MPALENTRHEAFAQYLAEGCTAYEAYEKAGYRPNDGNAIRLKGNDRIKARVQELLHRAQRQHDITIDSMTQEYRELLEMAKNAQDVSGGRGVLDSLAKLHGLWVEKHETEQTHRYITDEPMQPDGWEKQYASGSDATH